MVISSGTARKSSMTLVATQRTALWSESRATASSTARTSESTAAIANAWRVLTRPFAMELRTPA